MYIHIIYMTCTIIKLHQYNNYTFFNLPVTLQPDPFRHAAPRRRPREHQRRNNLTLFMVKLYSFTCFPWRNDLKLRGGGAARRLPCGVIWHRTLFI